MNSKISVDLTDESYTHLELNDLDSLRKIIFGDDSIVDCCGSILCSSEQSKAQVSFAVEKNRGMYIGIFEGKEDYLSLNDASNLSETIDVWGDDLLISEGLFIDPQIAWEAIQEYVTSETLCKKVTWISSADLPEGGNYI